MPTVEHIHFSPHDLSVKDRLITYSLNSSRVVIEGLPQIFWEDGLPWREANLWAMERVTNGEALLKTVSSNLNGLLNYAKFLESRGLQWFEFPSRKADRCLVQYRVLYDSERLGTVDDLEHVLKERLAIAQDGSPLMESLMAQQRSVESFRRVVGSVNER
ncbi:hypothetical protein SAMN05216475_4703 [Pseudomonas synxantha]|nr:hypothetical protein SAMN05216475_4703 [Pseudomonas synxantha]